MSVLNGSEAFAAWLPFWGVPFSYAVAVSYVLVDTADKGVKAYQLARLELGANASLHPEVDTPRCVLSLHKLPNPRMRIFWAYCSLLLCRLHVFAGLLVGRYALSSAKLPYE